MRLRFPLTSHLKISPRLWRGTLVGSLLILVAASGCRHMYADAFTDPFVGEASVTTASLDRMPTTDAAGSTHTRGHALIPTPAPDEAVEHGPIYFEYPQLTGECYDDERFALTWRDYVGTVSGEGGFLLTILKSPINMVTRSPWTASSSSGR